MLSTCKAFIGTSSGSACVAQALASALNGRVKAYEVFFVLYEISPGAFAGCMERIRPLEVCVKSHSGRFGSYKSPFVPFWVL